MNDGPIGIFDSGVGGLSVLVEIHQFLRTEDIVYFADSANCPYGPKSMEEIRGLAVRAAEYLIGRGAKAIVVACNTASAAALSTLRATFAIPFIGMVPAVKPASIATRRGKVGVIATQATFQAELFSDLVSQFAAGIEVHTQPCPGLVELVETGETDSPRTQQLLTHYLNPLLQQGIDTLVLGCTHYPFLRPAIERLVGPEVVVIDTGIPVARQVGRILAANNMASDRQSTGQVRLYTSGDLQGFIKIATGLLSEASYWEIEKK